MDADTLIRNWTATRTRVSDAAMRYGRAPTSVTLLAVSKGHPADAIRVIAQAGQRDFGENYVQQALPKMDELKDVPITWHFIGQIQSNKTRTIAERFDWVHTVDRERIAQRLNEQRPQDAPLLNVCLEVSLAEEEQKGGVEPAQLAQLARTVASLPRLRLRGLMCIPPHRESFDEQLAFFKRMQTYRDQLNAEGLELDTLSMGMSADVEAAIAAGATCVRIGTAIFGARE